MGSYTQFFFAAKVNDEPAVIDVLRFMLFGGDRPALPDHPLFKTDRWDCMLRMEDLHVAKLQKGFMDKWSVVAHSNFKNYDNEIDKFVDWIRPHLCGLGPDMIGFKLYEHDENPTIIRAMDESEPFTIDGTATRIAGAISVRASDEPPQLRPFESEPDAFDVLNDHYRKSGQHSSSS